MLFKWLKILFGYSKPSDKIPRFPLCYSECVWPHYAKRKYFKNLIRINKGKPQVSAFKIQCELCKQYFSLENMLLFRYTAALRKFYQEFDLSWGDKEGVRHICTDCIRVVKEAKK